jgi:hypothetical protein
METHAHHLHKAPGKKFSHYFFEFLMLFFAVFAGFIAENWREHAAEHQRAKEYAKALVKDFSSDTLELQDVIKEDRIILGCFDSITTMIQNIRGNSVSGRFYYYANIATFSPTVVWNNATLTQVTQSGSLRYFQDIELIKKLSSYYSGSDYIMHQNNTDKSYRDDCIRLRNRVLNNHYYSRYSSYLITKWLEIPDSLLKISIPLQYNNEGLLNEFANSFETRKRVLKLLMTDAYQETLTKARELIEILKTEYHLE